MPCLVLLRIARQGLGSQTHLPNRVWALIHTNVAEDASCMHELHDAEVLMSITPVNVTSE